MNSGFYVTLIVLILILTATFLFGMLVGRETAPQPHYQTISDYLMEHPGLLNDPLWTHRDDLADNLTPATQEYLEAHPNIVDPNR